MINKVLKEVLEEITPTVQEIKYINNLSKILKNLLDKKAKELKIKYTKIEPQGSTGIKQTQLKGDYDIDLFIGLDFNLYQPKYQGLSKNKLKKESKKDFLELCKEWIIKSLVLKEFHNPRLLYAEHPYVTVDYLMDTFKIKVDIVLYFDLDLKYIQKNGPITAVDRSPWHGKFIKNNLSFEQKNEVRLLKQFFKACHSYGDKSAVGKIGFFGYVAELLIYYYDSLWNLFNNFDSLRIKPLDYYNRPIKDLEKITHFQNDYLIIIDPIDKNRNVASAISERAYNYCNSRIQKFLKNPNKNMFEIKPISMIDLSKKDDPFLLNIYIIELKNKDKKVHYTINRDKLYSFGQSIKLTGENEFSNELRFGKIIFEVYFEDDDQEYIIAIYSEKSEISNTYIRRGPPIKEKTHVDRFKKKNPRYFEKDNFLCVESEREYTKFLKFLKDYGFEKIPENFEIINISKSFDVKTTLGKRTIYILKNMVLPFYKLNNSFKP